MHQDPLRRTAGCGTRSPEDPRLLSSRVRRAEEAVLAYREALKEWTRERVPLDWATTQVNLGVALETLGKRESGTGMLEEAVLTYREALKEYTPQTHQRNYQGTMDNLNRVLTLLKKKGNKKAAVH